MNPLILSLQTHPRLVAVFGTATGWWGWDTLSRAKDVAQFTAAVIAGLVSLCALILTAPPAIARVRGWFRRAPKAQG